MKKIIFTLISISLFQASFSQARYTFIAFKDVQKPALQAEYPYPEKTVSNAIDAKLTRLGFKGKDYKGYTVYRSVNLPELGSQRYDLYFKVDRKSRKEKDAAVVNMLISAGNENFIDESSNSEVINNGKSFLDNLMPSIAAYDLQQQINALEEILNKAEKKYKNLREDADDLQKRKRKIEQQIEENLKDQKDQQAEVEKQRQVLDALKVRQR